MTAQDWRLPVGGLIDRFHPLNFSFDGKCFQGFQGDTLASALLANGVHLVARSFKYHRPRGFLGAGNDDASGLVQLGQGARTEPNMRATRVELYEGLMARSQNSWPTVEFDLMAGFGWMAPLMPVGFYYKTFMTPANWWPLYERIIRSAAGMGHAPKEPDPDRYERTNIHCDVMIAGGGPAGLAAALVAGRSGARVVLADEDTDFGGSLLWDGQTLAGKPSYDWVAAMVTELAAMDEVTLLRRTTVTGHYEHNYLSLLERVCDHQPPPASAGKPRQRIWHVRARQVLHATGALERPLVFAGNDRPGVMLSSAVRTFVGRYAVNPCGRAVVFTNNDSAYACAIDLIVQGIEVAVVVDLRPTPVGPLVQKVRSLGIEVVAGHGVISSVGRTRVRSVDIAPVDLGSMSVIGPSRRVSCDLVAMSGGWNPTVHLWSQAQGRLAYEESLACLMPSGKVQNMHYCGAVGGSWQLGDCLHQGARAGAMAAREAGYEADIPELPQADGDIEEQAMLPVWQVPGQGRAARGSKHFVDFLNDVTVADLSLARREGFSAPEHAKRYTTLGMGTDQGRTSGINGAAILASLNGTSLAATGTTTFRPPYTGVTIGAMAGRDKGELVQPRRLLPLHDWHRDMGAVFDHVGLWTRPRYYAPSGETMTEAAQREAQAVRGSVGMIDASTFGKIEIQGPDCVAFLDRIYTNSWGALPTGRCKYGMMLGEDGMIFDDGITARLDEQRYFMTTNSGNAPGVVAWMERWLQRDWRDLSVYLTSVATQWGTITVCGPNARKLLARFDSNIDFSRENFPFLHVREGRLAGFPIRVMRVSFTGELSFEIFVPASRTCALWQLLWDAGQEFDLTAVGTEAANILRTEKGFIGVGHDTDGTVTPHDLGLTWVIGKAKKDFVGKRSLARADTARPDRLQLVGVMSQERTTVLPEGAQIVPAGGPTSGVPMDGVVTTSFFSPTLERAIALALVRRGRERMGEQVTIPLESDVVAAKLVDHRFYDPDGAHLHD